MEKKPLNPVAEITTVEKRAFSLRTPEGAQAIANLARLASREVTLAQLKDERYGIEPDGTLRLYIDAETFDLLNATTR
jgi:hypothetical protein